VTLGAPWSAVAGTFPLENEGIDCIQVGIRPPSSMTLDHPLNLEAM
jgi:hypothetical protein